MHNSIPSAYGALPFLGDVWAMPWFMLFIFMLGIDYGVINALMDSESALRPPMVARVKYQTFTINDTIVIPPFLALCGAIMHDHPNPSGWYTDRWWHWVALVVPTLGSIVMEILAVRGGVFTWRQELSPSKLYHTIIFGVMGYWMLTGLVAGLANSHLGYSALALWVLVACWGYVAFIKEPRWLAAQKRKSPINAHPELIWDGEARILDLRWPDD